MPRIVEEVYYNGARERIERLGLAPLVNEIKDLISGFELLVKESVDSNGGAAVRKMLDARFDAVGGWTKKTAGDIDWTKCHHANGTSVCVGVEIQVSARSDLLVVDMIHLTAAFRDGRLDIGLVIVPSDKLSRFLTDRGPCITGEVLAANLTDYNVEPFCVVHFSVIESASLFVEVAEEMKRLNADIGSVQSALQ
jgi:hypothetical protein